MPLADCFQIKIYSNSNTTAVYQDDFHVSRSAQEPESFYHVVLLDAFKIIYIAKYKANVGMICIQNRLLTQQNFLH